MNGCWCDVLHGQVVSTLGAKFVPVRARDGKDRVTERPPLPVADGRRFEVESCIRRPARALAQCGRLTKVEISPHKQVLLAAADYRLGSL